LKTAGLFKESSGKLTNENNTYINKGIFILKISLQNNVEIPVYYYYYYYYYIIIIVRNNGVFDINLNYYAFNFNIQHDESIYIINRYNEYFIFMKLIFKMFT
jgi:hypothetical protein